MASDRIQRARDSCHSAGVDALLVGPSADLRYLTGYDAPLLERMTLLVLPASGDPLLVVPELERPRASAAVEGVEIAAWGETEDPVALVRARLGSLGRLAVGDRLWAMFLLRLQQAFASVAWVPASTVMKPLRIRKDAAEIDALRRAAAAADRVAEALTAEKVAGRTERDVSRWITESLLAEGTDRVNFAIVASGPNAASPHHEPGDRVIQPGDSLVCDFGGTLDGYCSDITRTFAAGHATDEVAAAYEILHGAQDFAVRAAAPGVAASTVDAAARIIIDQAGYGEYFIHRTGHGIGLEEHEDPYLVAGNAEALEEGMAFSVEPGIYVPGSFGMRIEDIVVVTSSGAERLNNAPRDLLTLA
jgi:Xaa-Pro aminopeptidase